MCLQENLQEHVEVWRAWTAMETRMFFLLGSCSPNESVRWKQRFLIQPAECDNRDEQLNRTSLPETDPRELAFGA